MLLFVTSIIVACNQTKQPTAEHSTPSANEAPADTAKTYGAAFAEENVIAASELTSLASGKDSVQATVSAEVVESCQSKGCWMDVRLADNSTMKVTFRDYGFFLPIKDLKGKNVVFTGTAKREVVSVDDQRHYAKDAGKPESEINAITQPKEELRFVADGVIIK